MSEVRHFSCNLCEAMCGLSLTVENNKVTKIEGDREDVFSRGHICPKGHAFGELQEDPDRLRHPMRRTARGFERVSWDEALDEAATRLGAVQKQFGRDAVGLYLGNASVHALGTLFGAQALALGLGTKSRFDPNSQDSNPRTFACMQMYGAPLSVPVPDVERTDLMVLLGANPVASNGSMMALGDVRKRLKGIRERGGRMVLFDPRRTETAAWCDEYHPIRPGSDAALLLGMLSVLFAERLIDEGAVAEIADGLDEVRAIAARFPPERVAAATAVPAEVMRRLARELASTKRALVYARIGVCQNEFGPLASWLVEVVNLVTGHFDTEGGAMFATPAADAAPMAKLLLPKSHGRWRSRVRGLPEYLGALPSSVMSEEMETEGPGQIRAFVCYAGNPVLSTPNGPRLARALAGLDYFVAIDLYLNETTRLANLVLPPITALESGNFELVLTTMAVRNVARYSPPALVPPVDGRDDWSIASDLVLRMIAGKRLARPLHRAIHKLPEKIVDLLLRTGGSGLTLEKLRAAPHGIDLGPLVPCRERKVVTPDGRVRLAPAPLVADVPRLDRWLDERRDGLVLIGRRHLRSNNSWMHNLPSLVKGPDRAHLLMHPVDAAARNLTDGARVRVRSRTGELEVAMTISDTVMPGVVSLPHGYGHKEAASSLHVAGALAGPSANALTDELFVEPVIGTSILGGVPVEVEPGGSRASV